MVEQMASVIIWLATQLGITKQAAKFGLIGAAVVALIVGFGVAKCHYDKGVIEKHDRKAANVELKKVIVANQKAADNRLDDQLRLGAEAASLQKGIDNANAKDASAVRAAYYECVREQQLARKQHKQPPAC
jgi:hypothetical protein